MTPRDIQAQMLAIQPTGWALPSSPDSYWAARLLGDANELSLVRTSGEAFETEIDPRTADYMLPDYQRVLGPDPCGRDQLALTAADQAALVFQRWTAGGAMCAGYFVRAAAQIAVDISIAESMQSLCGRAACGDPLVPLNGNFEFVVHVPNARVVNAICGVAVCGDALGYTTPNLVTCVISAEAPLHTRPIFDYSS